MGSSRLGLVGRLVLALLAVFMLGAMVASAAQAAPTRALVWKVNGAVLGTNATKEITAKIPNGNLVLEAPKLKIVVTCTEGNLAKGSFIANEEVNKNQQAISESVAEFNKCTVTGNGANCKVEQPIRTKKIRSEFVLNDEETTKTPGNKILVEFDPRTAKEFVELKFEGSECKFKNTQVTELVFALLWTDVNGKPGTEVELGALPAETTSYIIKFPDEPKSVFLWSGTASAFGLFTPTQLKAFNETVTLTGELLILLASGEKYGLSETGK